MEKRNLPMAIIYCVLASLLSLNIFFILYYAFSKGGHILIISAFFIGISSFLYALFNCLFHWITKKTNTLHSLNKLAQITDIIMIFSFSFFYSFIFLNNAQKWVFIGINLFFLFFNIILFSIWTNIPYFLLEIFKDTMLISYIIFSYSLLKSIFLHVSIILIIIGLSLLYTLSIIFKYIFAGTKIKAFYNTSRILYIACIILNLLFFYLNI